MAQTVAELLTVLVKQAAEAAGHGGSPIPLEPCVPTNNPDHGDYQSNYAFRLGKAARTNPREVAQALVDALPDNDVIEAAEVAGPGFINFRLTNRFVASQVIERSQDAKLGCPQSGAGHTMVIDYSSPNIAKRMHIAHLRSTVIGNALDRLHRFLGYTVIADNHIGDWGTQFGKLIVMWHRQRDDANYEADPLGELQRLYEGFGPLAKEDPELEDLARAETAKLQAGDPENTALWQQFVDASMEEFNALYQRLDVHFDVTLGESAYRNELGDLIEGLLADGTAEVDEGAVVVRFTGEDGKGLKKNPLLIRKSDGAALYGTTDLATVAHRMKTWSPDRILYVTDFRQQLHFRQVFAACRKMGFTDVSYEHVYFGKMTLDGAMLSSRKGNVIRLVDVLDEAKRRSLEIVEEKNTELPEDEKDHIAEVVGTAAVKYFDLSQNPQSDIDFSWDRSLSMVGNSAPYLLMARARCESLLRKADVSEGWVPSTVAADEPAERTLALLMIRTPEIVQLAASTNRPNLLCDHLYALSGGLARFWDQCPVLKDDVPADVRDARLGLVYGVSHALKVGLSLLGIEALDRM